LSEQRGTLHYTGAWIEIIAESSSMYCPVVAPYTGAWIEIQNR